ncbi:MAG TPA: chloride channel protein, partial [Gaiellaceae bacterium]
ATPAGLVALALVVGAGAGAGAVLFRYLILGFTYAFTGHRDYSAVGHASYVHGIGLWFVVLAPVVGGLLYGPLIHRFAREARGHGVPEVMLAVAERGGRIRPRVALIKSLASALCIGSGGSVGREGPIVQIGSALGSTLGQLTRVPESRLRILVACGAAGGISATFNAPIAGVFFGLELILRDFEAESFGVVVLASFVADIIGRAAFGSQPFLHLPAFELRSPVEYLLYIGLGTLAAIVGIVFIRVLYRSEDIADRLWRGPEWLRPAAGGLLLGLLLLALPQLYGVGYPPLEHAVRGNYGLWLLLALLAGKILATSVTIAIGGSGGVFAPSLFMGAMLGSAYGIGVGHLVPSVSTSVGAYGIVGMGAVFAAAARAPITAVIIIFELTGDYRIILPLMFAVALAAGVSNLLSRDTIYTLKLRRRGIDIMRGQSANLMHLITVGEAMRPVPMALAADAPLEEALERLAAVHGDGLPVVAADGAYAGTLGPRQIEQALRDGAVGASAGDVADDAPPLRADQTLESALHDLVHARSGLPVVAGGGAELLGWLTHTNILHAYKARLDRELDPARRTSPAHAWRAGGALARLRGYRIVDLGFAAPEPPVGIALADVAWPPGSTVIGLKRGDRSIEPSGDERIREGDCLTVLVPRAAAADLVDTITEATDPAFPRAR